MIYPYCKCRDSAEVYHVQFLTSSQTQLMNEKHINTLNLILVSMKTPEIVITFLTEGLLPFYNTTLMKHQPDLLKTIHQNQQLIGWHHFSRGRITKGLREMMNKQYIERKVGMEFSGKGWVKKVITLMLKIHIDA